MLELLENLPPFVTGIRARGQVTAEDYQTVLIPAIERALTRYSSLRLIYILDEDFSGFSAGAAWEDARVGMRHLLQFERVAVVTDKNGIGRMVKAMGFLLPGDVRLFSHAATQEALFWIAEAPAQGRLDFELDRQLGVLILKPRGTLEAGDFRRVANEVDPYIDAAGGLSGVVVEVEEFPGWNDFAAFASHLRFIRDHQAKVRRVALVTGSRYLSLLPKLGSLFLHAEIKRFEPVETGIALAWAAAKQ